VVAVPLLEKKVWGGVARGLDGGRLDGGIIPSHHDSPPPAPELPLPVSAEVRVSVWVWQGVRTDGRGRVTGVFDRREGTVAKGADQGSSSWSLNVMMEVRQDGTNDFPSPIKVSGPHLSAKIRMRGHLDGLSGERPRHGR
jgi:hypothetical protein